MKTKQEIEKMKNRVELEIKSVQQMIYDVCNCEYQLELLLNRKRQLMTKYETLLEVLS